MLLFDGHPDDRPAGQVQAYHLRQSDLRAWLHSLMRRLHTSRLITPEEFDTMRKYDVTGIGLNLGTAEDFVRKTGVALPQGHDISQVGSVEGPTSAASVEQPHLLSKRPPDLCIATADICCRALHQLALPLHDSIGQPAGSSRPCPHQLPNVCLEQELKRCTGRHIPFPTSAARLGSL